MLPSYLPRRFSGLRPSLDWSSARLPQIVSSESFVSVLGTCYDEQEREKVGDEMDFEFGEQLRKIELTNTSEASIGTRLRAWEVPIGLTGAISIYCQHM